MKLKSNLIYSAILTLSTYLVPLLVFPYISRVLGVENIGMIDTADNIIDYCILFSMMGMSTLGIREIARNRHDTQRLKQAFSSLFCLNAFTTFIAFCLLWTGYLCIPQLQSKGNLLLIGSVKLVFNLFWIEWLFRGLEKFRYITIRSVVVRAMFVIGVFCLIKTRYDYCIYYMLFVGIVVMNALFNWWHRRNIVAFSFSSIHLKSYLRPYLMVGLFAVFSAIYTKLSVPLLSVMCGDIEAGYYTTAIRFYQVIIALVISLNSVLIPRMSVLVEQGRMAEVWQVSRKALGCLFAIGIPLILLVEILAPQLVDVFAGKGFEGAITPLRIVIVQLVVVGCEQIVILQLLIPLRQDLAIVKSAAVGVVIWVVFSIMLVPEHGAKGSAVTWVAAESATLLCALFAISKWKHNWNQLNCKRIHQETN